jgi:hypothetical protein
MERSFALVIAITIVAAPSFAAKVTIDYAHDFDFSTVKTFTYVDTGDTNTGNQLTDDRIQNAIIQELKDAGLEQVESGGDVYVTYHVTAQDQAVLNTTSYGYGGRAYGWRGYGRYGYGGMGTSTTTVNRYTEGTLIIDAYEPAEKNMVWRGTGTVTVKDDPQKQVKQIDKILTKLGKKWDKILANQGK